MSSQQEEDSSCLTEALGAGLVSGLKAAACSGALYYLAWTYSPAFRHTFNASARTALATMPIFYTGWLNVEQTMHECIKRKSPEFVLKGDDE